MRITLYGIPSTAKKGIARILAGGAGDVLWKLFVIALVMGVGYVLVVAGGVYGAVIGAAAIGTLINDDIRALVSDIWHRDWAEWEL